MNDLSSVPNSGDAVVAEFLQACEHAADPSAVLADYCRRYPQRAGEFRELAEAGRILVQATTSEPPPLPERLGEFRIVRLVAAGGMGEVYEAVQQSVGRRVAVKVIRRGRISPEARARFLREQHVLGRLHQTHIVPIHTAGEEGPLQYFAMQFIDGAALHHVVRAARETSAAHRRTPTLGKLAGQAASEAKKAASSARQGSTWGQAPTDKTPAPASPAVHERLTLSREYFVSVARVLAEAADAIQHAHGAGILHRDLKPSNIMVDAEGVCSIIDFGLAAWINGTDPAAADGDSPVVSAELSVSTGVVGTRQYMAPEQFAAHADVRTDVWGLGATLYELLTLRRAFEGSSEQALQEQILKGKPPRPEDLVANVPPDLSAICRKALRKEPGQRYATAAEFAADLRRWLRFEPTVARPARTLRSMALWAWRNPWRAVSAGAALLAFVAAAAVAVGYEEVQAKHARDQELQAKRALTLLQLQRFRTGAHLDAWSDEAMTLVRQLRQLGLSDDLRAEVRDQAAATLVGLEATPLKDFGFWASALAWDRDGKRLAMGVKGKGVHVWDSTTDHLNPLAQQGGDGPLAFLPDDTLVQLEVAEDGTGPLRLREVARGKARQSLRVPGAGAKVEATALSADGALAGALVRTAEEGTLLVWEAGSGKLLHSLPNKADKLAFSPDGTLVATCDSRGTVVVWRTADGREVARLSTGHTALYCLAFARDPLRRAQQPAGGSWLLAAGGAGGTLQIWDLERKTVRCHCRGSNYDVFAVMFSPDGAQLGSADRSRLKLWDAATGESLLTISCQNPNTSLAFSPDGSRLAGTGLKGFGHEDGTHVYQLADRGVQSLRGLAAEITKVHFSADGGLVAALSHGWQVGIWETATRRLLHVLEVPAGFFVDSAAMAFDADGKRFAFSAGTQAQLWDVRTGKLLEHWEGLPPGFVEHLSFHPAGKLLLFRVETKDGKGKPFGTRPKEHPRVCRIRDLLAAKPLQPHVETDVFNRHVFCAVALPDGAGFVVEGIGEKGRAVRALDGLQAKELWSIDSTKTSDNGWLLIDPTGRYVALSLQNNLDQLQLVEAATGKLVRLLEPGANVLGPEAENWAWAASQVLGGIGLWRAGGSAALVNLGVDTSPSGAIWSFHPSGSHLAWGNSDGTVSLADIQEVRRRLTRERLGW